MDQNRRLASQVSVLCCLQSLRLNAFVQLLLRQHAFHCTAIPVSTRHTRSRQRFQRCAAAALSFANCNGASKASGKARLIAGMEEEEFKGDVTDACVIDRGNGEYQVPSVRVLRRSRLVLS